MDGSTRRGLAAVAILASLAGARVDARPALDREARARAHFEAGRGHYTLGNYTEAANQFAAGYQLSPRPQFLLNLAQCYRMLDDLPRAQRLLEQYLREAPPQDPERPQVEVLLADVQRARAATPPPAPAPPLVGPPAPQGAPAPVRAIAASSPTPPRGRFWRRHWWIVPTGVVVLTGATLGLVFGLRAADDCAGRAYGCLDLSR